MNRGLISILTDFGLRDYFVASLKGVILSINPGCTIVDITHEVPDYNLLAAGFILWACYRFFPRGTIFLTVVDPGVGSERRILLAKGSKHYFIAPDNGVLSLIFREENPEIYEVVGNKYFLTEKRTSFEGRDRMAPAAAWLSLGVPLTEIGRPTDHPVVLDVAEPVIEDREIRGHILYCDKFGNLITSISQPLIVEFLKKNSGASPVLLAGKRKITEMAASYSSASAGRPFFLINSLGLLEIAVFQRSAAEFLGLGPGDPVILKAG
ncbi:MAG: SAM-dependent chlorinase/fluorinase [Candidatus Saccharicenans sp.]